MKLAFSEAKNATMFAISSGLPIRPSGTRLVMISNCFSTEIFAAAALLFAIDRNRSVKMNPGATAFTVMLYGPSSFDRLLVNPITPSPPGFHHERNDFS